MGTKLSYSTQRGKSYSPKGGQASGAFTQINNTKTRVSRAVGVGVGVSTYGG